MPEWITKYWIEWLFGLIIAGMTWVIRRLGKRIRQEQAENEALRKGMKALLRAKILDNSERAMRDGWCGPRLRDTISDLYDSYHALGGNGTVTSMVNQVMNLPAVDPGKGVTE